MFYRIIRLLENFDNSFFPKHLPDLNSIEESYRAHKLFYMLWFSIILSVSLGTINFVLGIYQRAFGHTILIGLYLLGLFVFRYPGWRKFYVWMMTIILLVFETYLVFFPQYPFSLFILVVIPSTVFVIGQKFFSFLMLVYHIFLYFYAVTHFEKYQNMLEPNRIEWFYSWSSIMVVVYLLVIALDLAAYYAFKLFQDEVSQRDKLSDQLMTHNRIKDQIFSIIGHDLKTPLSQVRIYVELGKFHGICDDEKTMNALMKNTDNAIELLHNLTDWARRRWEDIKPRMISFSLRELVNSLQKYFQTAFEQKKVLFENKFTQETQIISDPEMLTTVLRNLIQNALKFTNPQGRVTLGYEVSEKYHIIPIADNGVGMNQDQIKSIEHNRKIQSTRGTQKKPGSGLGLVICKDFLERLGGSLTITSTEQVGSVFSVHLPILTS